MPEREPVVTYHSVISREGARFTVSSMSPAIDTCPQSFVAGGPAWTDGVHNWTTWRPISPDETVRECVSCGLWEHRVY